MTYDEAITVLRDPDAHEDNAVFIAAEVVLACAKVSRTAQHTASVIAEALRRHKKPRLINAAPRGFNLAL
jgi:hypothetical protein